MTTDIGSVHYELVAEPCTGVYDTTTSPAETIKYIRKSVKHGEDLFMSLSS